MRTNKGCGLNQIINETPSSIITLLFLGLQKISPQLAPPPLSTRHCIRIYAFGLQKTMHNKKVPGLHVTDIEFSSQTSPSCFGSPCRNKVSSPSSHHSSHVDVNLTCTKFPTHLLPAQNVLLCHHVILPQTTSTRTWTQSRMLVWPPSHSQQAHVSSLPPVNPATPLFSKMTLPLNPHLLHPPPPFGQS